MWCSRCSGRCAATTRTTGHSIERPFTSANMRRRAEAALAADGVDRARLGYEVLVKLKIDELLEQMDGLLEQEEVPMPASPDGAHPAVAVTAGP